MDQINVTAPNTRSNLIFNVDSQNIEQSLIPDDIKDMAENVGIVDAINTINDESRFNDQELRQQHELESNYDHSLVQNPQESVLHENPDFNHNSEHKQIKKPQKKKIDKRIDDLTYRLAIKDEEINRLKQEHDAHLLEVQLAQQKDKIEADIARISEIMVQAKEEDQTHTYVEANKILNRLIAQESDNSTAFNNLQNYYQNTDYQNEQVRSYEKLAEEKFYDLSDIKELKSPYYAEWLQKNNYYNPYDVENFDNELASETLELKKNYNKFLKFNKKSDYIGTNQYYNDLDSMINQKYSTNIESNYSNKMYNNQSYNDQENNAMNTPYSVHIDPNYERSLPNQPSGDGPRRHASMPRNDYGYQNYPTTARVAPVNRSGYNNQGYSNQLPQLNEIQRKHALMMRGTDETGRSLSDSEKIQSYQEELMRLGQGR